MNICIENVSFGYVKNRYILEDFNLSLPKNKFCAVIGPNGSGKTTTVKCINKILKPQLGTIKFDGKDVAEIEPLDMAKMVAYVPQMTSSTLYGSVMDTVLLGRRPYIQWKISEEDVEIAMKVLCELEIDDLAQESFNCLSGGQKQKILIARALVQSPQIYLFDEPVSFLDVRNQLEIMTFAKQLVDGEGKTVVMVVHDLNMALRYADYVVIMKNGEIYAEGVPNDVITEENILAVYGVHAKIYEEGFLIPSL